MSRRTALSHAVLGRLATSLGNARKTRRTDFCNRPSPRAPVDRLTPEPAARTAKTASRLPPRAQTPSKGRDNGVGPPHGNPAPGRETLDGVPPASADSQATLLQLRRRRAPLRAALPCRGVFSRVQGPAIRPLTHSVAPSRPPDPSGLFEGTRIASTASSSKDAAFPTQCAFHQQVPLERSLARAGARHHSRSLAAGELASGALSPLQCSRTEWLDPSTVAWAIHP